MKRLRVLMVIVSLILVFVIGFETPVSAFAPIMKASEESSMSDSEITDEESVGTADLILGEIKSERTKNTKTFRLQNGNNMVVEYSIPIHFKNENGVWMDYDNSLQEESKEIVIQSAGDKGSVSAQNTSVAAEEQTFVSQNAGTGNTGDGSLC